MVAVCTGSKTQVDEDGIIACWLMLGIYPFNADYAYCVITCLALVQYTRGSVVYMSQSHAMPVLINTNSMASLCWSLFAECADTVTREVVRLIDEVLADTAATKLTDYCRDNPEVILPAGHYNMTGLLYYIGEHKSEMTCQEFVDVVGEHAPVKKSRVELAFE